MRNRISDATWTAFTEAIRFVVVPIVLITLVTTNYPQLETAFLPDIQGYILFFGGMIVFASTLECVHRPGTWKRLLYGMTALAFVCLWTFVIFGGGVAEFRYGPYDVRFDMSKLVYIMVVGLSLKGLLVINTFNENKYSARSEQRHMRQATALADAESRARKSGVRARARPAAAASSFAAFSKMAFEVTHDDYVGFSSPLPRTPIKRTLASKECPICGAKAAPRELTCKNCGAWFPKDSVR